MTTNHIDDSIISQFKKFFSNGQFDYIIDADVNRAVTKAFIYPTDDVYLTQRQFYALVSILGQNEQLFAMEMNWSTKLGFFDKDNVYFSLATKTYTEYLSTRFSTISLLFSDSFDWVILCDEDRYSGHAVMLGQRARVERFKSAYGLCESDTKKYVDYCEKTYINGCGNLKENLRIIYDLDYS